MIEPPYNWIFLKQFDTCEHVRFDFNRHKSVQLEYDQITHEEQSEFLNAVKSVINKECILILKNNYPYFTNRKIRHLVAWIPSNTNLNGHAIKKVCSSALGVGISDLVVFKNDMLSMSIPSMIHWHIFQSPFPGMLTKDG